MNENVNNTQDQAAEATTQEAPMNGDDSRIQTADEFGDLLFTWHNKQVATLLHFLQVPEGTEVQIGDDQVIALSADVYSGYKIGLELGLYYLGKLPFGYISEELVQEEATAEEAQPADDAAPAIH